MASPKNQPRDCGLYRTPKALPGHEDRIPAGSLLYFHNHNLSEGQPAGLPSVLPPDHNIHNRWHFHGPAIEAIRAPSWVDALESVLPEGFYTLKRELTFEGGSWPKGAIVQLGYNRNADPILFIGRVRARLEENDLFFSDKGVGIKRDQLSILERAVVFEEPSDGSGHAPSATH